MKKIILFLLIAAIVFACTKNSGSDFTPDCSTTKSYAADVAPVITSTCATNSGCHSSGSHEGPGALTNYSEVYANRSAIRTAVANGSMPQNGSLTSAQKNAIICWIDSGAQNN